MALDILTLSLWTAALVIYTAFVWIRHRVGGSECLAIALLVLVIKSTILILSREMVIGSSDRMLQIQVVLSALAAAFFVVGSYRLSMRLEVLARIRSGVRSKLEGRS